MSRLNRLSTVAIMVSAMAAPVNLARYDAGTHGATFPPTAVESVNDCSPIPLVWEPTTNLPDARYAHGAVDVNGVVYVVGGISTGYYPTRTFALQLDTQIWLDRAPIPRPVQYASVVASGGLVYVIGGFSPATNDTVNWVQVFDPAANTWFTRTAMPTPRWASGGATLPGGNILIAGGRIWSAAKVLSIAEEFSPSANSWFTREAMPAAFEFGAAASTAGGDVVYVGGYQLGNNYNGHTLTYDPSSGHWTTSPGVSPGRAEIQAAAYGNRVFVVGGRTPTQTVVPTVSALDAATPGWSDQAPINKPKTHVASVAASDGYLYAIGGALPAITTTVERARLTASGCVSRTGNAWLPLAFRAFPALCDAFESNDDRRSVPVGLIASGSPYTAKLCNGDTEDNYRISKATPGALVFAITLPPTLLSHAIYYVYAVPNYTTTVGTCSGSGLVIATAAFSGTCTGLSAGDYVVRLYTDSPSVSDDMNPYTFSITY